MRKRYLPIGEAWTQGLVQSGQNWKPHEICWREARRQDAKASDYKKPMATQCKQQAALAAVNIER